MEPASTPTPSSTEPGSTAPNDSAPATSNVPDTMGASPTSSAPTDGVGSATPAWNKESSPTGGMPASGGSAGSSMPGSSVPSSLPASDTLPANSMPAGMVSPKNSKKKMLLGGIIAAVVVILLGATAAAYYMVMNKPQNVLNMALVNSLGGKKVTSQSFDGNVSIKTGSDPEISSTFSGESNSSGAFSVTAKADAFITTLNLDARSTDGQTFYVRLGGLDGLSSLLGSSGDASASVYGSVISSVNNQWIQINQSMIKQLTGSDTTVSTKLSDADRQKLETAYKANQFLTVSKSLADESIKGMNSHHYHVTIDKDKLKSFIAAVKAANISSLKLTSDDIDTFNKSVASVDFSKYPVDVWISKSTKFIDQVSFSVKQDDTTITMRLTMDNFNKPVTVTAPSGAKSLLELFSGLLGGAGADGSAALDMLGNGISL